MFTVRCLGDRLPAHLAEVWNSGGILIGGMAAEIGFDTIDRQVENRGDFLVPQPIPPEFTDFELFGFCHNLPLSEKLWLLLTIRPRERANMRRIKKIKGCSHKT